MQCSHIASVLIFGLVLASRSIRIAVGFDFVEERILTAAAVVHEGVWDQTGPGSRNPAFSPHSVAGVNPLSSLSLHFPPVTLSHTLYPFCLFRLENI